VGRVSQDKQLPLFAAATVRQPVTRRDVILAKRVARIVKARGPIREADLAEALGCGWDDLRLAIGIASQWRRICRADAYVVPLARDKETPA
jgi:hypothetical protein